MDEELKKFYRLVPVRHISVLLPFENIQKCQTINKKLREFERGITFCNRVGWKKNFVYETAKNKGWISLRIKITEENKLLKISLVRKGNNTGVIPSQPKQKYTISIYYISTKQVEIWKLVASGMKGFIYLLCKNIWVDICSTST